MQDLKRRPLQDVASRAQEIWQEFLAEGAPSSINLDSHSYERTSQNLKDPGRYSYEDAQVGRLSLGRGGHTCMHGCFQPAQIPAPFPSSISRYGKSRKEGAERVSVFVLGPNEAANSMNGGFTRGRASSHGDPPAPKHAWQQQ